MLLSLPLPREEPGLIPPVAVEESVRAPWAPASPSRQQSLGACSCWQAAPCQRFLFIMLLLVAPRIARGPMGIPFPWSSEVPLAGVALGVAPRGPFWKGEQLQKPYLPPKAWVLVLGAGSHPGWELGVSSSVPGCPPASAAVSLPHAELQALLVPPHRASCRHASPCLGRTCWLCFSKFCQSRG